MPKATRIAYSYSRVSSGIQLDGHGMARQREKIDRYCTLNGYTLDTELVLSDEGVSAFRGENAETGRLSQFRRLAQEGAIVPGSALLIESLDRLSRDAVWRALPIVQEIINAGVVVVELSEPPRVYDLPTVMANPLKIMEMLMVFMRSAEESQTKSNRVRDAWKRNRAKLVSSIESGSSGILTSRVPAWLLADKKAGKVVAIKDRARVVRWIFQQTVKGWGQNKIANELNRRGEPTWGKAKHWEPTYIRKIISSKAPLGILVTHTLADLEQPQGKKRKVQRVAAEIPDAYPQLVSEELWLQAAAVMEAKQPKGRHAAAGIKYVFSGLLKCDICGSTITRQNPGKGSGRSRLRCRGVRVGICTAVSIGVDDTTAAFLADLPSLLETMPSGQEGLDVRLGMVDSSLSALSDELENLKNALGKMYSPTLAERLREAEQERAAMLRLREEVEVQVSQSFGPLLQRRTEEMRQALKGGDVPAINTALKQLVTHLTLSVERGTIELSWRHGGTSESAVLFWPKPWGKDRVHY